MDGMVREVNGQHMAAVETANRVFALRANGAAYQVGDLVSWTGSVGDSDVRNLTSKKNHHAVFQGRHIAAASLFVSMRG